MGNNLRTLVDERYGQPKWFEAVDVWAKRFHVDEQRCEAVKSVLRRYLIDELLDFRAIPAFHEENNRGNAFPRREHASQVEERLLLACAAGLDEPTTASLRKIVDNVVHTARQSESPFRSVDHWTETYKKTLGERDHVKIVIRDYLAEELLDRTDVWKPAPVVPLPEVNSPTKSKDNDLPDAQDYLVMATIRLETAERLAIADPGNAKLQHELASALDNVAAYQEEVGDSASALRNYRAAAGILKLLVKADPDNFFYLHDLHMSHQFIGKRLVAENDLTGALEDYRAALTVTQKLADADPNKETWRHDLVRLQQEIIDLEMRTAAASPEPTQPFDGTQPRPDGFESAQVNITVPLSSNNYYTSYTSIMLLKGQAATPINNNNRMTERKISAEAAGDYGLDQETAHRVLCDAVACVEAKRYADADSILHLLTPKQIVAVVDGSTVGKLYRRFYALMRELVLPAKEKGFTSENQAQMASQLLGTDAELRKHLAKLDIDWPKQEAVLIGNAMRMAFHRAKKRLKAVAAGHTLRRPGRPPRKDHQPDVRPPHN